MLMRIYMHVGDEAEQVLRTLTWGTPSVLRRVPFGTAPALFY